MPKSSIACVDANLIVRFVTRVSDAAVHHQWQNWRETDQGFVAPDLLRYEVANALHRLTRAGESSAEDARRSLDAAFRLPITFHTGLDLHRQALAIAGRLNLPAAYDAHYLALAECEDIGFFPANRRLASSVSRHLSWVRLVGAEPAADGDAGCPCRRNRAVGDTLARRAWTQAEGATPMVGRPLPDAIPSWAKTTAALRGREAIHLRGPGSRREGSA